MRDIIKLISEEETNSHFEFIKQLSEKAPSGKKAKHFINKATPDFKERYGDAWEQVLYATANKMFGKHHKKKVQEAKIVYSKNKNRRYNIYETPTFSEMKKLLENSKEKELRAIIYPDKFYVWDSYYYTHEEAKSLLEVSHGDGPHMDIYIGVLGSEDTVKEFNLYMIKNFPIIQKYFLPISFNMRVCVLLDSKPPINEAQIVHKDIYNGERFNIYLNPTKQDLISLIEKSKYKKLRTIILRDRFYVWDANIMSHYNATRVLDLTYEKIHEFGKNMYIEFAGNMKHTIQFQDSEISRYCPMLNSRFDEFLYSFLLIDKPKTPVTEAKIVYTLDKNKRYHVYETPTLSELKILLENSKTKELRTIIFPDKFYVWDAFFMDHFHARNELGINQFDTSGKDRYIDNKIYSKKPDNSFFNYFPILRGKIFSRDGQYLSIENPLNESIEARMGDMVVYRNPSKQEFKACYDSITPMQQLGGDEGLRALFDGKDFYVWNGFYMDHDEMMDYLGLDGYLLHLHFYASFIELDMDSVARAIGYAYWLPETIKNFDEVEKLLQANPFIVRLYGPDIRIVWG